MRFTDRLRRLNRLTKPNAVKSSVIAALLNVHPRLSDYALASLTGGVVDLDELVRMSSVWQSMSADNVAGTFHVSGTCRMGAATIATRSSIRPGACIGVGGLRVADASVMPVVPRGNTNIPTIMVAEKLATAIGRH